MNRCGWSILGLVGLVPWLCGCATPQPVRELANKTAENVALLNGQLVSYAAAQQEMASQRAALSAHLARRIAQEAADQEVQLQAMDLGGDKAALALYQNLVAASDRQAQAASDVMAIAERQRKAILEAHTQLQVPAEQLNALAKALAQMGDGEAWQDRLVFYGNYLAAVKRAMDDLEDQRQKALDRAKLKLSPDEPNPSPK